MPAGISSMVVTCSLQQAKRNGDISDMELNVTAALLTEIICTVRCLPLLFLFISYV